MEGDESAMEGSGNVVEDEVIVVENNILNTQWILFLPTQDFSFHIIHQLLHNDLLAVVGRIIFQVVRVGISVEYCFGLLPLLMILTASYLLSML